MVYDYVGVHRTGCITDASPLLDVVEKLQDFASQGGLIHCSPRPNGNFMVCQCVRVTSSLVALFEVPLALKHGAFPACYPSTFLAPPFRPYPGGWESVMPRYLEYGRQTVAV